MKHTETKITTFFTWQEMTISETAEKNGLQNIPDKKAVEALFFLVTRLLQPLRELYKKPVRVTSGYRSPEVNRLVGGVPDSQHLKGEAADCRTEDNERLLRVLQESGLTFDQAILYRKRNILHLSLKREGTNRKMVLIR
ncbi:MAG: D-Ala-D-Ala carboxypeptidase family metallohydrolase [Tannerellaceae bacterium]|nr:D-Ala-D-Ala carboxypeptidase family metallohydrolase [Tannerellaceae bacterium]